MSVQFDSNTWYQIINIGTGDGSGLQVGYPGTEGVPYGSVYGSPFDNSRNEQYWQIVQNPVDNSGWLIRCRSTGPGLFAAVNNNIVCSDDGSCPDTAIRVQPQLEASTVFDVDTWDDDSNSFYISPQQNGSDYRLNFQDNGSWIWVDGNAASAESNGSSSVKWQFQELGAINDDTYSTVSETASYTQTMTSAPSSDAPSPTQSVVTLTSQAASTNVPAAGSENNNSGLSTGAKAGIGAGVGGFIVLVLIVFGCWFFKRRRRHASQNQTYDYSAVESNGAQIVEAPGHESNRPAELEASKVFAGHDYSTPHGNEIGYKEIPLGQEQMTGDNGSHPRQSEKHGYDPSYR